MNNQITIDGARGTIQQDGVVRFGSDDQLNVLFYMKSVLDPIRSREMNRPIHKGEVYVRTQQPGERDVGDRPLREMPDAPRRWPNQWAAYQKSQEQAPVGTPVDILFPQNPEISMNLKAVGVHTVEQLAGLTAHGMETIGMGAMQWHNKAKEYLSAFNSANGFNRLQVQVDKMRGEIEVRDNQIAMLKQQMDRLTAQVQQGIPAAMIPRGAMTIASDILNETTEGEAYESYAPEDDGMATVISPMISSEPLFVEQDFAPPADDVNSAQKTAPKPRGRPPGIPNKPRHAA